jgi:excinuclease ABC subunit B
MYQIQIQANKISKILKIDPVSSLILKEEDLVYIFPAKHFITEDEKTKVAIKNIQKELKDQIKKFEKKGKLLEAERIKRRTSYDLAMIKEVGYCSGIENYSRHLSLKKEGEAPDTLLSYFPKTSKLETSFSEVLGLPTAQPDTHKKKFQVSLPNFLTIIDESHVTLPQLGAMYAGDRSRKETLVEYGFRLPSAKDNRPLRYEEFEERIGEVIYVSATPNEREKSASDQIVEQIIRPTGLLDPETIVRPVSAGDFIKDKKADFSEVLGSPTAQPDTQKNQLSYPGQVQDFIKEAEATVKRGFRVLATTLTKKMAEDLSIYLKDKKMKAEYLHSDIKTMDRIKILTEFRKGKFDVLVGVNLLREGLDLPEVALIGILDADKEGFLRSETSLIQIIGRAARNSEGRVILYADNITGSMERALGETKRRRDKQIEYNKKNKITPKTILKNIKDITEEMESDHGRAVNAELDLDLEVFKKAYAKELKKDGSKTTKKDGKTEVVLNMSDEERKNIVYEKIIKLKEKEMNKAVKELDFETAAILRDEIGVL